MDSSAYPSDALTVMVQAFEKQQQSTSAHASTGSYRSYRRGRVTVSTADDATRCRYPSKPCPHPRVTKASGALHRYCAYHRNKANVNQKRWVDRQRGEQSAASPTSSVSSRSSSYASWSPTYATTKYRWIMAAGQPKLPTSPSSPTSPTSIHESVAEEKRESGVSVEPPNTSASTPTGVENLSEDDWSSLLSILASDVAVATDSETAVV